MSISPHADNYLLKGALLFSLWYAQPHRPTRDVDLLGFGPDDIDTAVAAFREISAIEVEDGITFDPGSVKGSEIRKDVGYGGVRIDLLAKLDGARITLQVDIGFGDVVTPAPESVSYRYCWMTCQHRNCARTRNTPWSLRSCMQCACSAWPIPA